MIMPARAMSEKYRMRYLFEWGGDCLWPENRIAHEKFGYPAALDRLPLSPKTIERIEELSAWHDQSLNWDYPPNPGPWRQEECDRFNEAAKELLATICRELGCGFEIVSVQPELGEDPDLDAFIADPKNFRRKGS
jgi:hypothetical protein